MCRLTKYVVLKSRKEELNNLPEIHVIKDSGGAQKLQHLSMPTQSSHVNWKQLIFLSMPRHPSLDHCQTRVLKKAVLPSLFLISNCCGVIRPTSPLKNEVRFKATARWKAVLPSLFLISSSRGVIRPTNPLKNEVRFKATARWRAVSPRVVIGTVFKCGILL